MSDRENSADLTELAQFSEQLAPAIEALGSGDVPAKLFAALRALVPCDCALLLAYSPGRGPIVLFDEFDHPLRTNRLESYLKGSYLLDPFYLAADTLRRPALLRLSDIAPDDFDHSDYFVEYYRRSNVVDELNYLVPSNNGVCLALSLERAADQVAFTARQTQIFEAILPTVAALLGVFWSNVQEGLHADAADLEHERLVDRLARLGENILTDREREVTQLVLKGFSNHAVADRLGLSIETVKIHRRNIYRKLNISSLAELYSYALRVLSSGPNEL